MRSRGARAAWLVTLAASSSSTSGCALVAGIDDVHLVSDGSTIDSTSPFDAELDVSRDDGLRDSVRMLWT